MAITPRRRVLRPSPAETAIDLRQLARLQKRREQLVKEQATLQRWMSRLKRSFHALERQQARVARLERKLVQHEQG